MLPKSLGNPFYKLYKERRPNEHKRGDAMQNYILHNNVL